MDRKVVPDIELDCAGLYCPMPVLMTREKIDRMKVGQILKVEADDPAAEEDIRRWAKRTGQEILEFHQNKRLLIFLIKKVK